MKIKNFWADYPAGVLATYRFDNCVGLIVNAKVEEGKFVMAHPNCYVGVDVGGPTFDFINGIEYDDVSIDCHGGLTFAGKFGTRETFEEFENFWFFGWDYAHSGDCFEAEGSNLSFGLSIGVGKVYTFEEIKNDLMGVCKVFDRLMKSVKYYQSEDNCKTTKICDYCVGKMLVQNKLKVTSMQQVYDCLMKTDERPTMRCEYELERIVIK